MGRDQPHWRGEEEWWEQTAGEERKEERGRLDGANDLPLEGGRPLVKLVRREVARPRVEDLDDLGALVDLVAGVVADVVR